MAKTTQMDLTDEERALVEEHRRAQAKHWRPRTSDSYNLGQKRATFNALHAIALKHFESKAAGDHGVKNVEHQIFEVVMNLLGEGVWDVIND